MNRVTIASLYDEIRSLHAQLKKIEQKLDEHFLDDDLTDDDVEFNRRVESAWKDIDEGRAITMPASAFLAKLEPHP